MQADTVTGLFFIATEDLALRCVAELSGAPTDLHAIYKALFAAHNTCRALAITRTRLDAIERARTGLNQLHADFVALQAAIEASLTKQLPEPATA